MSEVRSDLLWDAEFHEAQPVDYHYSRELKREVSESEAVLVHVTRLLNRLMDNREPWDYEVHRHIISLVALHWELEGDKDILTLEDDPVEDAKARHPSTQWREVENVTPHPRHL